jgi:hypothetical protein
MARLVRSLVPFVLGLATSSLASCNNSSATLTGVTPSTAVSVDPAEFLGNVKCGSAAGEMQLYVATIFDVSSHATLGIGDAELALPSSLPTGCGVQVLFEDILDGREYSAAVDGYDRSDITPLAPGSRVMVDGSGAYVKPRWTTRCGDHRFPPSLRSADGGVKADAGAIEYADSGLQPDGGYLDCRPVVLYGRHRTPWLGGPVCAGTQETITFRGCNPLSE